MSERKYITKRRVFDIRKPWYTRLFYSIPEGTEVIGFAEAWTARYGRFIAVWYLDRIYNVREKDLEPMKAGESNE